jgi:hypothetical protein
MSSQSSDDDDGPRIRIEQQTAFAFNNKGNLELYHAGRKYSLKTYACFQKQQLGTPTVHSGPDRSKILCAALRDHGVLCSFF